MFADPFAAPGHAHAPHSSAPHSADPSASPFPVPTPGMSSQPTYDAHTNHGAVHQPASAPMFGGAADLGAPASPTAGGGGGIPSSPSPSSSPPSSHGGSTNSSTTTADATEPPFPIRLQAALSRQLQTYLDQSVPHHIPRWVGLGVLALIYCIRVWLLEGFYIVTYGLGIFLLNLLIGFLTPIDDGEGDPILPTNNREAGEFKPFIRRLPEFKFWYSCAKAVLVSLLLTFFSVFNVPVFWPILLLYFIVLFVLTMKRQIAHMWQHKYIPFSFGKPSYSAAKGVVASPPPKRAT